MVTMAGTPYYTLGAREATGLKAGYVRILRWLDRISTSRSTLVVNEYKASNRHESSLMNTTSTLEVQYVLAFWCTHPCSDPSISSASAIVLCILRATPDARKLTGPCHFASSRAPGLFSHS